MAGQAIIDLRNTYGYSFLGIVLSVMLFGIVIIQTWIYYRQYGNRDPKALKLFIAILFLLEILHTTLNVYSVYWYLILNFGNIVVLISSIWPINVQTALTPFIGCMVQLYYARRVYIVGKNIIIPVIIVVFGLASFFLGLAFSVKAAILKDYISFRSLTTLNCIGMGSGVAADILIALSMCWYLYHKKTGFAKTDSMITTIMAYSINSALLTSVFNAAVFINFSVTPSPTLTQLFFWSTSKLYVNSLLAMLNSRDYVRERVATDNAFNPSSIRIEKVSEADKFEPKRTAVSVIMRRSATTDLPQGELNHDVESTTVGIRKSEANIPLESRGRTSESSV